MENLLIFYLIFIFFKIKKIIGRLSDYFADYLNNINLKKKNYEKNFYK